MKSIINLTLVISAFLMLLTAQMKAQQKVDLLTAQERQTDNNAKDKE